MTAFYRVEGIAARRLFDELKARATDGESLFTSSTHRFAAPAPFGEAPDPEGLSQLRRSLLSLLADVPAVRPRRAALGQFLTSRAGLSVSDAGSPGVWNYLGMVLLPDVVQEDGGSLDQPRHFLCVDPIRHRLARYWIRDRVLGEFARGRGQFSEDEMVQLTERGQLARSARLVRILCEEIQGVPHRGREGFTRELVRRVTARTGLVAMDALEDEEIRAIAQSEAAVIARVRNAPNGSSRV